MEEEKDKGVGKRDDNGSNYEKRKKRMIDKEEKEKNGRTEKSKK